MRAVSVLSNIVMY